MTRKSACWTGTYGGPPAPAGQAGPLQLLLERMDCQGSRGTRTGGDARAAHALTRRRRGGRRWRQHSWGPAGRSEDSGSSDNARERLGAAGAGVGDVAAAPGVAPCGPRSVSPPWNSPRWSGPVAQPAAPGGGGAAAAQGTCGPMPVWTLVAVPCAFIGVGAPTSADATASVGTDGLVAGSDTAAAARDERAAIAEAEPQDDAAARGPLRFDIFDDEEGNSAEAFQAEQKRLQAAMVIMHALMTKKRRSLQAQLESSRKALEEEKAAAGDRAACMEKHARGEVERAMSLLRESSSAYVHKLSVINQENTELQAEVARLQLDTKGHVDHRLEMDRLRAAVVVMQALMLKSAHGGRQKRSRRYHC